MLGVANNLTGLNTHRSLKIVSERSQKASERLSTGSKINRAADDAAGLAIREKMRNQITGLNMASKNVLDGISLIQTAEGGMSEIGDMLKRQRELTIQAMNDTNAPEDRAKIQLEIDALTREITESAHKTEFNGIKPLVSARTEVYYFSLKPGESSPYINISVKKGDTFTASIEDFTVPGGQSSTTLYIWPDQPGNEGYPHYYFGTATNPSAESFEFTGLPASVQYDYDIAQNAFGGNGSIKVINVTSDSNDSQPWRFDVRNWNAAGGGSTPHPAQPAITNYKVTLKWEADPFMIKSGANENQATYLTMYDCTASGLGVDPILVSPTEEAEFSLAKLDSAIQNINAYRATAGSEQNRLEHTDKNLLVASENLSGAQSRISDTDMAKEMMEFTKSNILSQAGMSMLAQANQAPQKVMTLLQ